MTLMHKLCLMSVILVMFVMSLMILIVKSMMSWIVVTSVIYLRDVGEFDVTIGMGVMFFMIGIAEMFMYIDTDLNQAYM